MAFVLFEEITCFQLCLLCACERDGSRAYFAHKTSNHTCFSDFCDVSTVNREFVAFPSVNFFENRLIS